MSISPDADKGVVLVNSPKKGRHLIANQELPAGLTLLVLPLQSALVASEVSQHEPVLAFLAFWD